MSELLTAAQMRKLEQAAIDSGTVTGLELMERAGKGVVEAIFEEWPELAQANSKYATVMCGPGNNGGDGFVITRLLRRRGWFVDLVALGNESSLKGDARRAFMALNCPCNFVPFEEAWRCGRAIYETETKLVIDAVFGIGLDRPMPDEIVEMLCSDLKLFTENDLATKCVAVDLPSGLDSDTGLIPGGERAGAFSAHLTVTFHRAKPGHILERGPTHCGRLVVKDIGL